MPIIMVYFADLVDPVTVDVLPSIAERFEKEILEECKSVVWTVLGTYFLWTERNNYVDLKIVFSCDEFKAASSEEVCYKSTLDLTSLYFRVTSTGIIHSWIAVLATPVECFKQKRLLQWT